MMAKMGQCTCLGRMGEMRGLQLGVKCDALLDERVGMLDFNSI